MEDLQASYKDDDNGDGSTDNNDSHNSDILSSDPTLPSIAVGGDAPAAGATTTSSATPDTEADGLIDVKDEPNPSEDDEITDKNRPNSPNFGPVSGDDDEEEEEYEEPSPKKQKHLSSVTSTAEKTPDAGVAVASTPALHPTTKRMNASATATDTDTTVAKKSKKKNSSSVWTKPTSRKGKKKNKNNNNANNRTEETVAITPIFRFPDKTDDTPDMKICLSKVYKAEKVELSDDRLSAGSTKGYRMVRATRGVMEGAWYFEIRVVKLGETGHTRLGWSTDKGDLQAPVGYDANSFGYRDIDGSKIHKALREQYGEEGYGEGDVIGFYIKLPDGSLYAPKPPKLVWYKGQRYACAPDEKEDPPKIVPGSEISFFKNGICQGVAFQDLYGGRYYPVASMYTLPNQPNCVVKFNFGPDFDMFPKDFGDRSIPRPMIEVPYHGYDGKVENANGNHPQAFQSIRMCPTLRVVKSQASGVADTA